MNAPRTRASIAFCNGCAAELRVSARYRLSILASGWFLFWLGTLVVLHTPAPWFLRLPLVCGWTVLCVCDAARQAAAFRRVSRITMLADGRLIVGRRDGSSDEARLADGCRLFGEFAWLRIRFADGRIYGVWLGAKVAGPENWRRFKSLWQYGQRCE